MDIHFAELLIFAVAVGFLVYAFTGSRRSVGLVICAGVFLLLGIRFMNASKLSEKHTIQITDARYEKPRKYCSVDKSA